MRRNLLQLRKRCSDFRFTQDVQCFATGIYLGEHGHKDVILSKVSISRTLE